MRVRTSLASSAWPAAVVSLFLAACGEEKPPAPPPFSVQAATERLAAVALDDAFFAALDELRSRAGTDPEAAAAYARYAIAGLGAALSGGSKDAGQRLIGGDTKDPKAVGAFLARVAAEAKAAAVPLAQVASALAGTRGASGVSDLSATIAFARGDADAAPAVRLVLASILLEGLSAAANMPEAERGPELIRRVPGLPNAPTRSPAETVFPATLGVLQDLLSRGAGKDRGLEKGFARLAAEAATAFGDRVFPMPVGLGLDPTPRAAGNGLSHPYMPLAAIVLGTGGLSTCSRPAIAWRPDGAPLDRAASVAWPGTPLVAPADLDAPKPDTMKTFAEAIARVATTTEPIEGVAFRSLAGKGVLNAERKGRKALLVAVDPATTAAALRSSLAMASEAGYGDLRLLQPGAVGAAMPVLFRTVPAVEGVQKPSGRRILAVLTPQGCELYPPGRPDRLPVAGWPEGTKVVQDQKKFFKLFVGWTAERGFEGKLALAVAAMREKTGAGPFVDVVVRPKDVTASEVLDAAAEIEAPGEPAFPEIDAYFPGAACAAGKKCLAAVPILFSDAAVPRPREPEVVVKETRPAGFCDKAAVQRVILGRSGAYRACYEVELQRHPDIAGRVELRFTI